MGRDAMHFAKLETIRRQATLRQSKMTDNADGLANDQGGCIGEADAHMSSMARRSTSKPRSKRSLQFRLFMW